MLSKNTETPRLVSVMHGGTCTGFLIDRGARGVEAFDADEKSFGVFPDAISATIVIKKSSAAPDATGGAPRRILGVDPGIHGGLAIIAVEDGAAPRLVETIDIPVIGTNAKERVDAIAIRVWVSKHDIQHAFIERAQAMPKQGSSSGFKYGARSRRHRSGDRAEWDTGDHR
jgi:hypothetical protein